MLHRCLVSFKSYYKIHVFIRLSCSLLIYGTVLTGWCKQGWTPRLWRVCSYLCSMFNFHWYIHCWFAIFFHVAIDRNKINQLYVQLNIECQLHIESQFNRESQFNIESLFKVKINKIANNIYTQFKTNVKICSHFKIISNYLLPRIVLTQ